MGTAVTHPQPGEGSDARGWPPKHHALPTSHQAAAHSFFRKTFGCWGINAAPIALLRADEQSACERKVPFHLLSKLFLLMFIISPVSHPIINADLLDIMQESWAGVFALYSSTKSPCLSWLRYFSSWWTTEPIMFHFHCPEPIPHPVTPGRGSSMAGCTSTWSCPSFAYESAYSVNHA